MTEAARIGVPEGTAGSQRLALALAMATFVLVAIAVADPRRGSSTRSG